MMKRIPLSNRIGCYCYLVYNRLDLESALQNSDSVDVIYTVGFKYNHKSCIEVSNEEADHIKQPSLPIWLISDKNYISVCDGDFLRIHPITAEVIPSFNCCFRCEQCAYRLVKEQLDIWNGNDVFYQMSKDNMKLILTRLAEGGVRNIIFTGGGEPLCNLEGTLYGMSICKQLGLNFGIYTNGYFLDKEVSQKIISYNPEFIRVSIYGMDDQCFKKYTHAASESFTKVIGNIKQLIKQSRDSKSTTYIALSFLLHPNLYDNSEMIWKLTDVFTIEELKCFKSIRFTPAVDYDTNKQHSKSFFNKLVKEISAFKSVHSLNNIHIYYHRLNDISKRKSYNKCLGNGFFAEVGPNGEMYLCCEKVGKTNYIIGNLLTSTLSDIWTSEQRKTIVESIICSECPNLCKPHETNKQLESLLERKVDQDALISWVNELWKIVDDTAFSPGYSNAFES